MLHATSTEFILVFPGCRKYLCWIDLSVSNHCLGGPIIDCNRVLVVFANRKKSCSIWGESQLANRSSVETSDLGENFTSSGIPDIDIDKFTLSQFFLLFSISCYICSETLTFPLTLFSLQVKFV